jgi:vacuolar-type H+-ATPase subunit E/Vma4
MPAETTQTPALFDTMAQEVQADCDRRLGEARREAERILAEGRRVADQEYARGIETTREEISLADRRERQRLDAEHDKAFLAVQHKVVEEVLARVGEEIRRLSQAPDFGAVLEALLAEILAEVRGKKLDVLAPPAHADRIAAFLQERGRGELRVIPWASLTDGVAVQDRRRTYRVSNTLSGRLVAIQDEARKRCQARLFAKREG